MINNIPQLPEMVITKADNHPIWVNGTDLVNGMPIITDNHKDETRLNEFIAAGFTPQYIQWLTVNDPRYRIENHSPVTKRSYHPKSVSYAGIKAETQVWSRGDDPIIAVIQGTSVSLVCAGVSYCVCSAPAGKSKSDQAKFCKAVVRSFLDDPSNVWDYVPLNAVPEKEPAVCLDNVVENITLSPFPGPAIVEEIEYTEMYAYREKERDAINTIIIEYGDDPEESPYEITGRYLNQENNPETSTEIINAFCKSPPGLITLTSDVISKR